MTIESYKVEDLHFDLSNPRMVEFYRADNEQDLLNLLWVNMAVEELVLSILANGFFQNEALYVVKEEERFVVVEGNRRLAAVKAILHPEMLKNNGMQKYADRITPQLLEELNAGLPVILLPKREDAWRYIGFKHVNGAAKWDSYAKAEYIAQVHNDYNVSLSDIALQIGDSNQTTQKLYLGLMVLNQADRMTEFKKNDVYYKRIYFSHVYTAIMYTTMQQYLGLNLDNLSENPIPDEKLSHLEEVMIWLLGSKKQNIEPVVRSQNPGVRQLCQVLTSQDAISYLRVHRDLEGAVDWSRNGSEVLADSIVEAASAIQKAMSKVPLYDGSEQVLKSALDMVNQADFLFRTLKNVHLKEKHEENNIRTID